MHFLYLLFLKLLNLLTLFKIFIYPINNRNPIVNHANYQQNTHNYWQICKYFNGVSSLRIYGRIRNKY